MRRCTASARRRTRCDSRWAYAAAGSGVAHGCASESATCTRRGATCCAPGSLDRRFSSTSSGEDILRPRPLCCGACDSGCGLVRKAKWPARRRGGVRGCNVCLGLGGHPTRPAGPGRARFVYHLGCCCCAVLCALGGRAFPLSLLAHGRLPYDIDCCLLFALLYDPAFCYCSHPATRTYSSIVNHRSA